MPPSPPVVRLVVVIFFVVEAGRDGAFAQDHVERLLDIVGVQLLVEVDDVVVLFLVGGFDDLFRVVGLLERRVEILVQLFVDDLVVDQVFVVVVEALVECFLVELLFVELGLFLELVVTHAMNAFVRGRVT